MASSEIKKWAAHTARTTKGGGVKIQLHDENDDDEDDFESELVLPDGPLHLHVVPRHPHSRSHSEHETASSSGGSALFSDSDEQSSKKDDDDDGEEDEKSNTIKANQLPASFASQLALSKAQAALDKAAASAAVTDSSIDATAQTGKIHNLGSVTQTSPQQAKDWDEDIEGLQGARLRRPVVKQASFTSHISDDEGEEDDWASSPVQKKKGSTRVDKIAEDKDDIEGDFDLPESVSQIKLSTSTLSRHRQASSSGLIGRSPSPALSFSSARPGAVLSGQSSRQSTLSRSHGRSVTSLSHGSSASTDKNTSNDGDADFFDDIVLPPFFGGSSNTSSADTPPSSVDSKASQRLDLQKLLKEKLANKAGITKMVENKQSSSGLKPTAGGSVTTNKGSVKSRYREKAGEAFEDGLVFEEDEQAGLAKSTMAEQGTQAGPGLKAFPAQSAMGNIDRLSPLPTTRTNKTSLLRTSKSNTATSSQDLPRSSSNTSLANDRTQVLRSRPSISNLSTRTASPGLSSETLSRKKSVPFLSSAAIGDTARPASPSAHYAQPTRSFLARHQSTDSYTSLTGAAISYNSHLRSAFSHNTSRPSTPSSIYGGAVVPSSPSSISSRLTQPTLASRAKARHIPTGSDPSGRSSAALGRPLPSSTSLKGGLSALPLSRELRQPARRARAGTGTSGEQDFGDGSELDGFDDLSINKEKEKKFMKLPVRRRQSSGTTETVRSFSGDIPNSAAQEKGKGKLAMRTVSRERIESAPERLQSAKRRLQNASGGGSSAAGVGKVTTARVVTASVVEMKRPKLQLIKGLNAAGLSKVQGEMKWNPQLMKWEGNESSLQEFDNVLASSARPALISPVFGPMSPRHLYSKSPLSTPSPSTSTAVPIAGPSAPGLTGATPQLGGVRVVGDMIFDPVRMSWFTVSEEGEEELDFGDDEADTSFSSLCSSTEAKGGEKVVDAWEGGEQYRLKTRRSFANDWSSNASESGHGGEESGAESWSFEEFKKKTVEAERANDVEMKPWMSLRSRRRRTGPASSLGQQRDLSHLYDIRDLVRD